MVIIIVFSKLKEVRMFIMLELRIIIIIISFLPVLTFQFLIMFVYFINFIIMLLMPNFSFTTLYSVVVAGFGFVVGFVGFVVRNY